MDRFFELQEKGVIDTLALHQHFSSVLVPTTSRSVSDFFFGKVLSVPGQVGVITAVLLVLNAILLWRLLRRERHLGQADRFGLHT